MPVQLLPIRQSAELQRRKLNEAIGAINTQEAQIAALEARVTDGGTALPAAPSEDWVLFIVRNPPAPTTMYYSYGGAWELLV